jgi:2-polyprenyl-3-methyl-5-hydroxy-6-metoxy-1,4-benzoquinol methylase
MADVLVNVNDFDKFPDVPLNGRNKLSISWFPKEIDTLLDGGCSFGYGTRYFAEHANKTYGVEINPEHYEVAKSRFKNITFKNSALEKTDFDNEFFDVIVLNDVLEHTNDKIQTLSELNRILKSGGTLILSTPHKGLFQLLDPYNYGYYLKKYFSFLYNPLYKLIRLIKTGKIPKDVNPEHGVKHYHYSLKDYNNMLQISEFKNNYKIDKVFRSGLLIEPIYYNLERIFDIFMPAKMKKIVLKPFFFLAELEYWIPTGILAYNIAVRIIKK